MILWSDLRNDAVPAKLLRAVAVGWVMGAVIVIHCVALATIVFSGPLLPYTVQGTGMMLFGGVVFCLLIGVTSSYRGMLAVPQEVPATVLGTMGAAVATGTVRCARRSSVHDDGGIAGSLRLADGPLLPGRRTFPTLQSVPLHPLSGHGRILRRYWVRAVTGGTLGDDRGGSGLADASSHSRTRHGVEVGTGRGLRARPGPGHEAQRQPRDHDGGPRARQRALSLVAGLSGHLRGGRQGGRPVVVGDARRRTVARLRDRRPGVCGLERRCRAGTECSERDRGHAAVPAGISERPGGGHRRRGRSGPGVPGGRSGRNVRRRRRERTRLPFVRLYPAVLDARSRHPVDRGCRRFRVGSVPVLRQRTPGTAPDVDHRRAVALHWRRSAGQLADQGSASGCIGRTTPWFC